MRSPDPAFHKPDPRFALLAGGTAIGTAVTLIIAKTAAWMMTGSASVLASLTDSMMDAWVSGVNLMAIRYSLKPADEDHRYGHGKIEGIAALFQAALMSAATIFLCLEATARIYKPAPIDSMPVALGVMALSTVLSTGLVLVQRYCLRRAASLAVESDQAHYSTDIVVNAGTFLALFLIHWGAPLWIDSAFAFVVAVYLARTAYGIGMKGYHMLMDRELPEAQRIRIVEILRTEPRISGVHDLRTRAIGMRTHVSFDVEIDPKTSLQAAHDITRDLETAILKEFPHAEIMIHMDPAGDPHDSRHPDIAWRVQS
jgi:ferrous-iron efflux pump FieF